MELKQLFDTQSTLDERIIKQHKLEGKDLLDQRILALNVELAELAQETRCFKFWSTNQQPSERVLDELVDVLHFVLSVGLTCKFEEETIVQVEGSDRFFILKKTEKEIVYNFHQLFSSISDFSRSYDVWDYCECWNDFIELYLNLGFTWEQVTQAYMEKNKENHDRQDRGY